MEKVGNLNQFLIIRVLIKLLINYQQKSIFLGQKELLHIVPYVHYKSLVWNWQE